MFLGGGSGHEPSHAGLVGDGMLSAAVCGEVFSSPPWADVVVAIKSVAGPKGVLLVVKNYTGEYQDRNTTRLNSQQETF